MSKIHRCCLLAGAIAACALMLTAGWWQATGGGDEDREEHSRTLNVSWAFTLRNGTAQPIRDASLTSFAPAARELGQELIRLGANAPLELLENGRTTALIRAGNLPPYGQRMIFVEAEVRLAAARKVPVEPASKWLTPSTLVQSDDQAILALAHRLRRDEADASIRAIYDWVVGNMNYSGYDPIDRGASYALRNRSGDCSEFAALTVALSRALGMPARLASGYVARESGALRADDYHAWAEILVVDRWMVVDPQRAVFDAPQAHYLVTAYDDTEPWDTGSWNRFNTNNTGLSISMR